MQRAVIVKLVPKRLRQKPERFELNQNIYFPSYFNSHENATGNEGLCQILRMALSERQAGGLVCTICSHIKQEEM